MGELEGRRNSWGYVEGGMGRVSAAIAAAARSHGAEINTDVVRLTTVCEVKHFKNVDVSNQNALVSGRGVLSHQLKAYFPITNVIFR